MAENGVMSRAVALPIAQGVFGAAIESAGLTAAALVVGTLLAENAPADGEPDRWHSLSDGNLYLHFAGHVSAMLVEATEPGGDPDDPTALHAAHAAARALMVLQRILDHRAAAGMVG